MSRRWHLVGVLLVGLVLLAAATVLDGWLPGDDDDPGSEPFVRTAGVGETVALRTMTVEVDSVSGSATISRFGSELASPGLWVVIQYTVTPRDENGALSAAQLTDRAGRTWSLHGRSKNLCSAGPPGVAIGCLAYFEVPPDAVSALHLRLAPAIEQRYDAIAEIDLGLTSDDAGEFGDADVLELPETTLGGR